VKDPKNFLLVANQNFIILTQIPCENKGFVVLSKNKLIADTSHIRKQKWKTNVVAL